LVVATLSSLSEGGDDSIEAWFGRHFREGITCRSLFRRFRVVVIGVGVSFEKVVLQAETYFGSEEDRSTVLRRRVTGWFVGWKEVKGVLVRRSQAGLGVE
jgi:hypothetical protein